MTEMYVINTVATRPNGRVTRHIYGQSLGRGPFPDRQSAEAVARRMKKDDERLSDGTTLSCHVHKIITDYEEYV